MNILYFGDSNVDNYMNLPSNNYTIDRNDGLCMGDMFDFLFSSALDCDLYTRVIVSIGTNDLGHGYSMKEIKKGHARIREIYPNALIVGPYGDIDTRMSTTFDGLHFDKMAKNKIGTILLNQYIKHATNPNTKEK